MFQQRSTSIGSIMDIDRITGAVTGGIVAGLALSAVMLAGEKLTGKPSELIELKRKAAAKLGISTPAGDATGREQLITHGGHLTLSALAGLAYAVIVDEKADGVKSGAAFGLAFFVAAYGLAGPLLGVTPPPWRESPMRAVQHPVVHTLLGICAALFARDFRALKGQAAA